MGLNNAPFNNKDLLYFLAAHIQPRTNPKLTFPLHDPSVFDPFLQAVTLFDNYRRGEVLEDFATDMLTYMVTDSITKDFVLNQWLLHKESPEYMFYLLRLDREHALIGIDDLTLFTAWLEYVKMYLKVDNWNFHLDNFVNFILPIMSLPRAKVMFESNALESVLGDVEYKTSNLAARVRDIWRRFPQDLFFFRRLYGQKITQNNIHKFVGVIASIGFYVESKPFNGDLMFDLLNKKHSLMKSSYFFKGLSNQSNALDYRH